MTGTEEKQRTVVHFKNAYTPTQWHKHFENQYPNLHSFRSMFSMWAKEGKLPQKIGGHQIVCKKFKGKKFYEIDIPNSLSKFEVSLEADVHLSAKELYGAINHNHYSNMGSFKAALLVARQNTSNDRIKLCGYEIKVTNLNGAYFYQPLKLMYTS